MPNYDEYMQELEPDHWGLIRDYFRYRKMVMPNEEQAFLFMITEVAELAEVMALRPEATEYMKNMANVMLKIRDDIEKFLFGKENWVRNSTHGTKPPSWVDEVAGVQMMLEVMTMVHPKDGETQWGPTACLFAYWMSKGYIAGLNN